MSPVSFRIDYGQDTMTVLGLKASGQSEDVLVIVDGITVCTLPNLADGVFNVTLAQPQEIGTHNVVVRVASCSAASYVLIPQAITLTVTTVGHSLQHTKFLLDGYKTTGSPADINAYLNDQLVTTRTAAPDGGYHMRFFAEPPPQNDYSICVKSDMTSMTLRFSAPSE